MNKFLEIAQQHGALTPLRWICPVCGIVVTREVYGTMTHYYTTPYHWHDGRVYYCVPDEQAEAYERSIAAWMRQQAEAHRRAQEYLKDWPP